VSETTVSKVRPIKVVVLSDKMNKSRVGVQERLVQHAEFGKYIRRRTKFMFHDEKNETTVGDVVLIKPSRPLSARKRFALHKIVKKTES
jgi:small subunit ribosomal protein S17